MKIILISLLLSFSNAHAFNPTINIAFSPAWLKGGLKPAPGVLIQKTVEVGMNHPELGFAGISLDHYFSNEFNLTAILRGYFLESRSLWANIKLDLPTSVILLTGQSVMKGDTFDFYNYGISTGYRFLNMGEISTSLFLGFESFIPSFQYHHEPKRYFSSTIGVQISAHFNSGDSIELKPSK